MEATELAELPEIPEQALITDPAQFDALNSAFRMRILRAATTPASVRELSESLEVPVTRLYYHVNLLEEAGFLEVVHTRKSGARLEKLYRVAGRSITPAEELAERIDDPAEAARVMASIVIEPARIDAEAGLASKIEGEDVDVDLAQVRATLTPDELDQFTKRLQAAIDEVLLDKPDSDDPAARPYTFMYVLAPTRDG